MALGSSYVVQDKVELLRQSSPSCSLGGGQAELGFRDLVVDLDPFVFEGEVEGFLTRLSGTSLANVTSGRRAGARLPRRAPDPETRRTCRAPCNPRDRPVGPFALLALGVNGIVGVGIFFVPATIGRPGARAGRGSWSSL